MRINPLFTLSTEHLVEVTGGRSSLCFQNDAAWYPKRKNPLPQGGQGWLTRKACEKAVRDYYNGNPATS